MSRNMRRGRTGLLLILIPATISAVAFVVANQSVTTQWSAFVRPQSDHASAAGQGTTVPQGKAATFGAVVTSSDSSAAADNEFRGNDWSSASAFAPGPAEA